MNDLVLNVGLIVGGLMIVLAALGFGTRLSGKEVLYLDSEKLGVKIRVNAFGLLVLFGAIVCAGGGWLQYRNYEAEIRQARADLEKAQSERAGMQEVLNHMNQHKLRLNLIFPPGDGPAQGASFTSNVLVQSGEAKQPQPYPHARVIREFAGIVADVRTLAGAQ